MVKNIIWAYINLQTFFYSVYNNYVNKHSMEKYTQNNYLKN